ncbi:S41 family peptidase [Chryseobacterium kwangjuense]|uniref:S41 family peptidase n=1 Tax=Chryseobacterium kwangjuense TaxID=267125 RepID=A0ABW9K6X5_9FLAO
MKLIYFTIISFLIISQSAMAQDNPRKYLEDAILVMRQNSVNKGSIDWQKVTKNAIDSLGNKKTIKEVYPVIISCLEQLGDNHSKFFKPEVVNFYMKSYKENGEPFPYPKDSLIDNHIGYISIPSIGSFNDGDWNIYVSDFYKKVKSLDSKKLIAWVIDVRGNEGGMFSPMFKAVQPFLDKVNVIGSKDNKGQISYYTIKKDNILFDNRIIATIKIQNIKLRHKNIPIFILTDKKTASSGEFVVASFVGQENVTIVGTNTQGLTSDNSEFKLSDGSFLVLTTGNIVDRNGKEYIEVGKGILPDIKVVSHHLNEYINVVKGKL